MADRRWCTYQLMRYDEVQTMEAMVACHVLNRLSSLGWSASLRMALPSESMRAATMNVALGYPQRGDGNHC